MKLRDSNPSTFSVPKHSIAPADARMRCLASAPAWLRLCRGVAPLGSSQAVIKFLLRARLEQRDNQIVDVLACPRWGSQWRREPTPTD